MDTSVYVYCYQEDTRKVLLPQTNCVFLPGLLVLLDSQKAMVMRYLLHLMPDASMGESFMHV